jgi:hypothetical protein
MAIVLSLTGAAFCQSLSTSGGRPSLGIPLEGDAKAPPGPQSEEHERAYRSAIEKIAPKQQKSDDPWQGVRSGSAPQSQKSAR